jgi:aminoglycoside N3'-acetyltransferase
VTADAAREALERLGLRGGETVYLHASLRRVGHVVGGPSQLIEAIMGILGKEGTLVMPALPAPDAVSVNPAQVFDVAETPSLCGLLSETLRRTTGALRSEHPIASAVALGARAEELTRDHLKAETPFGAGTPWSRLADGPLKVLLLAAHAGPLLYHIQERARFPHMYATQPAQIEIRGAHGRYLKLASPVMRADVPPVVILPGNRPESRDYLLMPDYALMYPAEREKRALEAGYLRFNQSRFLGRRERWVSRGLMKVGTLGMADVALLDGNRMIEQITRDLIWDIARFREEYDPEQLAQLRLSPV